MKAAIQRLGSQTTAALNWHVPIKQRLTWYDPRHAVALILLSYLILGVTFLGFNRTPIQIGVTTLCACALEMLFCRAFRGVWIKPLSAFITSLGLSLLLNYSHTYWLLIVPVFFAIGSKYVFTLNGKHAFNPALFGIVASLVLSESLITASPAYQWNGLESMAIFIVMPSLMVLIPGVNRFPLVISFLVAFTAQTALRAMIMQHHLPFSTLFFGTLTSPAFFLFTFFMITDPATSPKDTRTQVFAGISIAILDLLFHISQSYFTFFYAAFVFASGRLLWGHWQQFRVSDGWRTYLRERWQPVWARQLIVIGLGVMLAGFIQAKDHHFFINAKPEFKLTPVDVSGELGIDGDLGDVYEQVDPRVQHIIKWIFSVGDAAAVADVDGDGFDDLFLTQTLKQAPLRGVLYRNTAGEAARASGFAFEPVPIPALAERSAAPEVFGLPTNGLFADYDNDGDQDLLVTYAFGHSLLLQNRWQETGLLEFVDVTEQVGLTAYTNSIAANFQDLNQDGWLDLIVTNVIPTHVPDMDPPTELNLFDLPEPAYEGDRRMLRFMHASWHQASNGGSHHLYLGGPEGFKLQDNAQWGIEFTGWSLAVGSADFNDDGLVDIYIANDFGPDEFYLNVGGERLQLVQGRYFGDVGRDTYKGMNVSIADVDRSGGPDIYVSNVHHHLQAEGSLLWLVEPGAGFIPQTTDVATEFGALNERRFGWGAAFGDLDLDGWIDLVQANGMVDDTPDKRWDDCPDYWYINEKLARSPPSIHSYADMWGDLRGACIHGKERNRVYLNRGNKAQPRFVDVAPLVGATAETNSRGVAMADFDRDGDYDLVITHMFAAPTLYRNDRDLKNRNRWLAVHLEGRPETGCNRSALGSVVTVRYTSANGEQVEQRQVLINATGFSAQSSPTLRFGLGADVAMADVEVAWCGQRDLSERYDQLRPGQVYRLGQR